MSKTYLTMMIVGGDIQKSELDKVIYAIEKIGYSCYINGNGNIRFEKTEEVVNKCL